MVVGGVEVEGRRGMERGGGRAGREYGVEEEEGEGVEVGERERVEERRSREKGWRYGRWRGSGGREEYGEGMEVGGGRRVGGGKGGWSMAREWKCEGVSY